MSDALILALLSVLVPLVIFAIAGALHNAVKVTRLETKLEPMWEWWIRNHRDGK